MSDGLNALLRAFIESDASPNGKWWVDVPVGLSIGEDDDYTTIDAVCLTSREQELPEVHPQHTGPTFVTPEAGDVGVSRVDMFQTLREQDTFAEESVVLVASQHGSSDIGTVGELLVSRTLLEADWEWDVEELLLVSDEDSDHVNHACRELDVRAVRVA